MALETKEKESDERFTWFDWLYAGEFWLAVFVLLLAAAGFITLN